MIFVQQYLFFDPFELLSDGCLIIVVETMALTGYFNAHGDVQAVGLSAIEDFFTRIFTIVRSPGAEGIAAVLGQLFHIAKFQAGALDPEGFTADIELVFAVFLFDLCFYRALNLLLARIRGTGKEQGGKER